MHIIAQVARSYNFPAVCAKDRLTICHGCGVEDGWVINNCIISARALLHSPGGNAQFDSNKQEGLE